MISVILEGPMAIDIARRLKQRGFTPPGVGPWDLGPDFGQVTARVLLTDAHGYGEAVAFLERSRENGWLPGTQDGWFVKPDGPPFSMGGDISVVGTVIE